MSTTLSPTELVRLAWITALRTQGRRKCKGDLWKGTRVCAMGMLAEVIGENDATFSGYSSVGSKAGLTEGQIDVVIAMNDGMAATSCGAKWLGKPQTFAKIAKEVEGWFK